VPGYRISSADCRERLASVFLFEGRLQEAEQALKEVLALAERLAEQHPADRTVRMTLAMASRNWGETLRRMARPQEVEKAFRRAEAILDKLVTDVPQDTWYRLEWGVTCQMLVSLLARDLKQPQAAEEFYRRDVAIFEKLTAEFARERSYRWWLADAHREWAFCLRDIGRTQEANKVLDLAIADYSKVVELRSKDFGGVWYPLALLHLSTGRTKEYRALCETLLERFGQGNDPDLWVIATCKLAPDAVADLARPVQLAEKMAARHPGNADFLGVLGDTLYRKGDLDAAVQRQEASIRAAPGIGVPWRKLFLAMAYHRLGRPAQAQQLLREAVQWIEKNGQEKLAEGAELKEPLPWSRRLDLQLLRREAEELLAKKSGQ
jgi:tetratricopeptide (TPR) repeat protein